MGWTAEELEFDSRQKKEIFSVLCRVKTDSGTYPAPHPMITGASFPENKAAGA
jgi:hypothetical protein